MMPTRPHKDRLLFDLNATRQELISEASRFTPEEFDWTPAEGMKSCKALLVEIGTMETICSQFWIHQKMRDWGAITAELEQRAESPSSLLKALDEIRAETVSALRDSTEDDLQAPLSLPESWHGYFNSPTVEPEELLRWIVRHEYYHLGQIIIYRWVRGDNPYARG
jgi:uncharacterized damage-inducible protein DinB